MVARKQILIEIKARANQAIGQVNKLSDAYNKSRTAAQTAATKGFDKASASIDKAAGKMDKFAKRSKSLRKVLTAGAGIGIAIGGAAIGFSKLAAEAQKTDDVLKTLGKFGIDGAVKATGNLVDRFSLAKTAVSSLRLGVVETEEDFIALTRAGSRLARSIGLDSAQGVDNLSNALARNETEVLDNLGIVLKVSQAQELYAEQLGKSTRELTTNEKASAFRVIGLQKAIEISDELNLTTDTLAGKTNELTTEFQNLARDAGPAIFEVLTSVLKVSREFIAVLDETSDFWAEVAVNITLSRKELDQLTESYIAQTTAIRTRIGLLAEENDDLAEKIRLGIIEQEADADAADAEFERSVAISKRLGEQLKESASNKKKIAQLKVIRKAMEERTKATQDLTTRERELNIVRAEGAQEQRGVGAEIEIAQARARAASIEEIRNLELEAQFQAFEREKFMIQEQASIRLQFETDEIERRRIQLQERNDLRNLELQETLLFAENEAAQTDDLIAKRKEREQKSLAEEKKAAAERKKIADKETADILRRQEMIAGTLVGSAVAMGDAFAKAGEAGLAAGDQIAAGLAAGTASLLKELRNQMVALAASETAKGLASLAGLNPVQAGLHFAAAGAAVTGAVVAGGASRAIESRNAPSAGSRGFNEERAEPVGAPVSREDLNREGQAQRGRGAANGGGGNNVTNNFTVFGSIPDDQAREMGRQIKKSTGS